MAAQPTTDMNPEFWQGKRVLVTGHTSFAGSWLCLWLQDAGARLTGYGLQPPTQPSMFEVCDVADKMDSVMGDLRDIEHLHRTLAACQPEIVFHMAEQPERKSSVQPVETFHVNVMGMVHLLEGVRRTPGIRAVVAAVSEKCYVNREWYWSYREKSQLGGDDPYSSSQACAELVLAAYLRSYFDPDQYAKHTVGLATARTGSVIGGGDWSRGQLVADVTKALLANEPVALQNPHAIRAWQHVLEPIDGYLTLAEHLYEDGPLCDGSWNFGPLDSNEQSVAWIAEKLHSLWGTPFTYEQESRRHPRDSIYRRLDVSKARALLDWRPRLDLENTLSWIVEWTKNFQLGANMRAVTQDQIRRFTCVAQQTFSAFAMFCLI